MITSWMMDYMREAQEHAGLGYAIVVRHSKSANHCRTCRCGKWTLWKLNIVVRKGGSMGWRKDRSYKSHVFDTYRAAYELASSQGAFSTLPGHGMSLPTGSYTALGFLRGLRGELKDAYKAWLMALYAGGTPIVNPALDSKSEEELEKMDSWTLGRGR